MLENKLFKNCIYWEGGGGSIIHTLTLSAAAACNRCKSIITITEI